MDVSSLTGKGPEISLPLGPRFGDGREQVLLTDAEPSNVKEVLRHFEFAVLTTVDQLGADGKAFPAEVTRHLSKTLGRHVALAQVFIALERLEDKGLVKSWISEPEPVRGGRRRRVFQMEASGARALRTTAAAFTTRASSSESPEEPLNEEYQVASP